MALLIRLVIKLQINLLIVGKALIYPVILSGGVGSRLWPVSRVSRPKQFLALSSDNPLIVDTAERVLSEGFYAPTVVCNVEHRFLVGESFSQAGIVPRAILLEPEARDTAAAIVSAAYSIFLDDPDAIVLAMPSDHSIKKCEIFSRAILDAQNATEHGKIVTFGIEPTHPETGYGYIEAGEYFDDDKNIRHVVNFHEKPNLKTASEYIATDYYSWNSGIFMFKASSLIDTVNELDPDYIKNIKASVENAKFDLDFIRLEKKAFSILPKSSFDVAVMEKTDQAVVIPVDMGWSDVGSWRSLWDVSKKDDKGNVCVGGAELLDCSGSLAWNEDGGITTMVGVEELVVVVSDGSVLVVNKNKAEKVKDLVSRLEKNKTKNYLQARTIYRPWGYYQSLDSGEGYLVKRISVKVGARLSLQYHFHRAEHWVVVSGIAKVTRGEDVFVLKSNQSTYLPMETIHRLENIGDVNLVLIEVQTGEHLSEDDIVRLEDVYGRYIENESV
ncbi:mannose-1-phosphate guanylyltransferase/mannose-6-phosphate isomerase [Kiloniella sp.]|uniref:mannose-1-phosphate guanylyltransferase/mannose-6-phosphate isomerase n=1 Tax=Kiloniella sp. TaxID=1938587 RepID=UPI003A8F0A66